MIGDDTEEEQEAAGEAGARVKAVALDERPTLSLERSDQLIGVSEQPIVYSDSAHSSIMHAVNDCARAGMYRYFRMSDAEDRADAKVQSVLIARAPASPKTE